VEVPRQDTLAAEYYTNINRRKKGFFKKIPPILAKSRMFIGRGQ
jgi:hypothetical protein